MMQCLTNPLPIVGITDSECICVTQGKTDQQLLALRASSSGKYMNKLPGGIDMDSLQDFGTCNTLLTLAREARDQAIIDFEDKLTDAINTKYKNSKKKYIGLIGERSYDTALPMGLQWQGTWLRPNEYTDAVILLKGLEIVLNASGATSVYLYRVSFDSVMGELLYTWPVNAIQNTYTPVNIGADSIELPLIYNNNLVEYYFAYDGQAAPGRPLNTKFTCNCSGRTYDWKAYIQAQGFQASAMNMLNNKQADSQYTRGLIFNVEIACDSAKLFCNEYIHSSPLARTIATTIWLMSGDWFINYVLKSNAINQYTTMSREYLMGWRNHYQAEWKKRMDFMPTVIDLSASNCYVCKQVPNQPYSTLIEI